MFDANFIDAQHQADFLVARSDRIFGGADRDRTGGLLVANQALSQLSYSPTTTGFKLQGFKLQGEKPIDSSLKLST